MEKTPPHYIDTPAKLKTLLKDLQPHKEIGLDTEFISEGRYEPALCLLQLSTADRVWIVDPLAVANLKDLWGILVEPGRELVAVAARQEIKFCAKGAGVPPAKVLDLQIAAGLVGYGYPLSHTNLLRQALGIQVEGRETYTDWKQRPLSNRQVEYAADDVRHLLELRRTLLAEAERLDRIAW